jgi:hypothetical protein
LGKKNPSFITKERAIFIPDQMVIDIGSKQILGMVPKDLHVCSNEAYKWLSSDNHS